MLYRLRGDLGQDPIVSRGRDGVLALVLDVVSDRDLFLAATQERRFADAVDLYTGKFFPAFAAQGAARFEQWADLQRAQLKEAFLRSATEAVRQALDQPDNKTAARLAAKARDCCPESQAAWCLLLEALVAGGNRARAFLETDRLLAHLAADGEAIEPATERLIAKVRQVEAVASPSASEPPGGPLATELAGREAEFAMLMEAWRRCERNRAVHIHLTAPAGLGKTRLLRELANRLRPNRAAIALIGAIPGEREVDHAFLSDAVEALTLPGWRAIAPGTLAELSALAPSLSAYHQGRGDGRSRIGSTATLIRSMTELVSCVAGEAPLALLLDDLHWGDDQSLQIINGLINRLKSERVLIVTTARPTSRLVPVTPSTEFIELAPLTAGAVLDMLASLGADVRTYDVTALAEVLHAKSHGSPLLVLEQLHLALQRGRLQIDENGWTWANPATALKDFGDDDPLRLRIEGLSTAAQKLLLLISTAQAPVPLEVLTSADADAHEIVLQLERDGLVARMGQLLHPAHDEVAAAALRSAPDLERRKAHRVLGEWLFSQLEKDRTAYRRSARHLREAEQPDRLRALFWAQVTLTRRQGSETPIRDLARSALGPDATTAASAALVRSLGWVRRLTYARRSRAALLAGAVAIGTAVVGSLVVDPAPEPEAILLVSGGDPATGVRVYGVPISSARWAGTDTIVPRERQELGRLPTGHLPYYSLALNPDRRLVFDEVVGDSGGIDLMMLEGRRIRRLTFTPGDDISPSWSPDGRLLVFATARWTPPGDEDSDLAVLDPETGAVRQLTRGRHYDSAPRWSPDGIHIAFDRIAAETGLHQICAVTFDGLTERCAPGATVAHVRNHGWLSSDRILFARNGAGGSSLVTSWFPLRDSLSTVRQIETRVDRLAPGTSFATAIGPPTSTWQIVDTERQDERHLTLQQRGPEITTGWFVPNGRHRYLAAMRIDPGVGAAIAGLDHRLRAVGYDTVGRPIEVSLQVLRWTVDDSTLARIDPTTGQLFARKEGTVRVGVSAGGWRTASIEIPIVANAVETQSTETWTEPLDERWQTYGDPLPSITTGPGGLPALLNGGDNTFSSGVLSRTTIAGQSFGVEALVSTPIDRPKWQRLNLKLIKDVEFAVRAPHGVGICSYLIPVSEGVEQMRIFTVTGLAAPTSTVQTSGEWYRFRIQAFPDATCGVAIDGVPLARVPAQLKAGDAWHFMIDGQTVGTQMLVGPIETWTGVKTDIDWSVVGATGPVTP
ncbi:MAG: AAA family ATPase [Gemmatimonadales bacterium]|nr:AAA family ATPase [Gemmatimonadales bacterium]